MMRVLRRVAVLVGGGALLTIGVAMIVLPGPAVVVIPAAIGVLAIEFEWARRWLRSIRAGAARATNALRGQRARSVDTRAVGQQTSRKRADRSGIASSTVALTASAMVTMLSIRIAG